MNIQVDCSTTRDISRGNKALHNVDRKYFHGFIIHFIIFLVGESYSDKLISFYLQLVIRFRKHNLLS